MNYEYAALITCFTSILQFILAYRVGMMRSKHGVSPRETYTTKQEEFIVAHRIQMNTIESIMMFLPLLWIATLFGYVYVSALIGAVWFVSRILFAVMYQKETKQRTKPFMLGVICLALMCGLAIVGIIL